MKIRSMFFPSSNENITGLILQSLLFHICYSNGLVILISFNAKSINLLQYKYSVLKRVPIYGNGQTEPIKYIKKFNTAARKLREMNKIRFYRIETEKI